MNGYSWDFFVVFDNFSVLLRGLVGTIKLASVSLVLGMALGLPIGAGRWSQKKIFNWPASAYIEVFRNTPALVQLMWFYYALPILIGMQLNAFSAGTIALTLNTAAFCAEIFRAGIQSIDRGQWEAGRAIGMNFYLLMRRVILPQAVKRMVPAFTNRAIELTKMTSLASTIAYMELLYEAKLLSTALYRPIEIYLTAASIYFVVLYSGTLLVRRLEIKQHQSS